MKGKTQNRSEMRMVWVSGYPAHYMGELHRRIESIYHDVFFIYANHKAGQGKFEHEKTSLPRQFILLSSNSPCRDVWFKLNQLNPKSILVSGYYPISNMVAILWAKVHKRPIFYLADSNYLDEKNLARGCFARSLLHLLLCRMDKLLYLGSRNRDYYLSHCGKQHVTKHGHWFPLPHLDSRFLPAAPMYNKQPFQFLYFGRLEPIKCVDHILESFSLLRKTSSFNCELSIAGDGSDFSRLKKLTLQMGLRDYVHFLGSIPSDHAPEIYANSSAVILASQNDAWGLVVNEALSSGKPVIGPFWIGAFADLVLHERTGLVTRDNSPEKLMIAMKRLLEDPAFAYQLGLNGKQLVCDGNWSIKGSLASFARLYNELN